VQRASFRFPKEIPMRILVTGGAGFIGSHVVDAALAAGHSVAVLDNLSTGSRAQVNPAARFHEVDLTDRHTLARVLKEEQPAVVNHHAAQTSVRISVDDPTADAQVNIAGSLNLLEECRHAGVAHVIFSSTGGAMYGEAEIVPTREEYPAWPVSPYGIAKLSVEHYLYYYRHQYGLAYTVLRYANVYGPRQNPHGEAGVVAIFSERLLGGRPAVIYGDGEQTRDYVFVGDVVQANLRVLESRTAGTFNIGTGVEATVNQIYQILAEAAGVTRPPEYAPGRPGEQRRSALDARHATNVLGWRPSVPLVDGLRRTVEWFRSR
jgi:UDP-glucose 4-epimerase